MRNEEPGTKRALVIVVSDSVYEGRKKDETGNAYANMLRARGWTVEGRLVVPNNPEKLTRLLLDQTCTTRMLVVVGGTGASPRDISVDVVENLAWRSFPGFGEEFRRRSAGDVGARGLGSRAGLYQVGKAVVAVLPGSRKAVDIAVPLLDDMVPHILEEFQRPPSTSH